MPTILFTDIEGSTRLWEEQREAMSFALTRHDAILTDAIQASGGQVLKTTGDGFIAVFDLPGSAVASALKIQEDLGSESWGTTTPIKARIGVHAGDTEQRNNDLFGPTMNRTARIMGVGHGGQVLLSEAVATVVKDSLPTGASLVDLGFHRLKDLASPEHLYQLSAPRLLASFPPLRSLNARRNNLPVQATEFLGRTRELADIKAMVELQATRLLTITGPGGAGKTRLVLQAAADLLDQFRDGTFFVDLSQERSPEAVFDAIVRELGLDALREGDPIDTLKARLQDRQMLLVLDNFEHVMPAAVAVSDLLQRAPELKILVTSREALRVRAERVITVPPLTLPDDSASKDEIASSEAVRFFEERARAGRPDFAVTSENAAAVSEICVRLDGLPLAIELAAARLKLFAPAELLARLRERLDVLGSGGRDLPDRQRTLWSAIDWSYELLNDREKRVFEKMSVFTSASLVAIEAVVSASSDEGFVPEIIESLMDKSLIQSREQEGKQRFSMLRTVSEYASAKLAVAPEIDSAVREAHARYFAGFSADLRDRLRDQHRDAALQDLEVELGNLRTAWRYWIEQGSIDQILAMIDGFWTLHESKGWYYGAIELSREALAVLESSERSQELATEELTIRASLARTIMAVRGYNLEVEREFERVVQLANSSGIGVREFPALRAIASFNIQRRSWEVATGIGEQLKEIGEKNHNPLIRAEGHYVVGASTLFTKPPSALGNLGTAISLFGAGAVSSDRFRLGPNTRVLASTASALMNWQNGSLSTAVAQMNEALQIARSIDHPYSLAYALYHSGYLAINRRRFEDCMERARELSTVSETNNYPLWATLSKLLEGVGLAGLGRPDEGLTMTEEAVGLYQGLTPPPVFWPMVLTLRAAVHAMAGMAERAIALLDEAGAALVYRDVELPAIDVMKADILSTLPDNDPAEIEALYLKAIGSAERLGFRLDLLTAQTGLVSLSRSLHRSPDGSAELADVLATFDEGHDEHDVSRARTVLNQVADRPI